MTKYVPPQVTLRPLAADFLREHPKMVSEYHSAIERKRPCTGSVTGDEWALVFDVQRLARKNGNVGIGYALPNELRKALRWAWAERRSPKLRDGRPGRDDRPDHPHLPPIHILVR